jgi:hypothetical protein
LRSVASWRAAIAGNGSIARRTRAGRASGTGGPLLLCGSRGDGSRSDDRRRNRRNGNRIASGLKRRRFGDLALLFLLDPAGFREADSLCREAHLLDLALDALLLVAFARLVQRTGASIHLIGGKLTQYIARSLGLLLFWPAFAGRCLARGLGPGRWWRGLLRLMLGRHVRHGLLHGQGLFAALLFDQNGFRPAMTEALADMTLLDRPFDAQGNRLASRSRGFVFRFSRLAHSQSCSGAPATDAFSGYAPAYRM